MIEFGRDRKERGGNVRGGNVSEINAKDTMALFVLAKRLHQTRDASCLEELKAKAAEMGEKKTVKLKKAKGK